MDEGRCWRGHEVEPWFGRACRLTCLLHGQKRSKEKSLEVVIVKLGLYMLRKEPIQCLVTDMRQLRMKGNKRWVQERKDWREGQGLL